MRSLPKVLKTLKINWAEKFEWILDQDDTDSENDIAFQPPKNPRRKSEEPAALYTLGKDGLEVESDKDQPCKRKKIVHTSSDSEDENSLGNTSDKVTKVSSSLSQEFKLMKVD